MKFEVRLDIFNLLDTVQFTGLNSTVNFRSLTDKTITNLPYRRAGKSDTAKRIRDHHQYRDSAHAPTRHSHDVLASVLGLEGALPSSPQRLLRRRLTSRLECSRIRGPNSMASLASARPGC